ncbi:MAG: FHA domain-containing protein [Planctomycetaceae bacterium]|jgi:hypothetical protein|nr:FHA domain-containing protein [Planctomycetaceae bacterium]
MSEKITISLEETNSSKVDTKIRIDNAMLQAAQHQQEVLRDYKPSAAASSGNVFQKAVVYLALFGLLFGFGGWCLSEIVQQVAESQLVEMMNRTTMPTESEMDEFRGEQFILGCIWFIFICSIIGFGLSSAEGFMDGNYSRAFIRGFIAVGIGIVIGPVVNIAANSLYRTLGGGGDSSSFAVQMFARALGWAFAGCFVGIAPGIVMRNWKKLGLGVAGGAIGGLLGGLLFDPIGYATHTGFLSRMVGIVGFGVLAGLMMGLLEEAAKQGWLKVVTGVIAGKQFIIYRNPTVIGSSPKCEIYLFKDTEVMPQHAAIRQQGKSYTIEQIDQRTPVLINGVPKQRHTLRNGDTIGIGKSQFVFGTKDIQHT